MIDRCVLQMLPARKCVKQQLLIVGVLPGPSITESKAPASVNDAVLLEDAETSRTPHQLLCRAHCATCYSIEACGQDLALADGITGG